LLGLSSWVVNLFIASGPIIGHNIIISPEKEKKRNVISTAYVAYCSCLTNINGFAGKKVVILDVFTY